MNLKKIIVIAAACLSVIGFTVSARGYEWPDKLPGGTEQELKDYLIPQIAAMYGNTGIKVSEDGVSWLPVSLPMTKVNGKDKLALYAAVQKYLDKISAYIPTRSEDELASRTYIVVIDFMRADMGAGLLRLESEFQAVKTEGKWQVPTKALDPHLMGFYGRTPIYLPGVTRVVETDFIGSDIVMDSAKTSGGPTIYKSDVLISTGSLFGEWWGAWKLYANDGTSAVYDMRTRTLVTNPRMNFLLLNDVYGKPEKAKFWLTGKSGSRVKVTCSKDFKDWKTIGAATIGEYGYVSLTVDNPEPQSFYRAESE